MKSVHVDHATSSVGGRYGHYVRRFVHLGMGVFPWMFYFQGEAVSSPFSMTPVQFVTSCVALVCVVEILRLYIGIPIFGQREYELRQPSAVAWGAVSMGLVFLTLPDAGPNRHIGALGLPIIWTLIISDPIIGEIRRADLGERAAWTFGLASAWVVWICCGYFFSTPWILVLMMPPVCIAAERPQLKWLDDNATMQLIPLAVILYLQPWLF